MEIVPSTRHLENQEGLELKKYLACLLSFCLDYLVIINFYIYCIKSCLNVYNCGAGIALGFFNLDPWTHMSDQIQEFLDLTQKIKSIQDSN